jgi:5-methylcytosine-specific restriction endonuclease McrA
MTRLPGQPSWSALSAMVTASARCAYCGAREDLVAHHKVPRKLGGADAYENLEPVCRSCHPRIEQDARAEAELSWERPERERPARPRRRPRLKRPY